MNVATIKMPVEDAMDAYFEYRENLRNQTLTKEDKIILTSYKALMKGQAVIDLNHVMQNAGLDNQNRPKLAIARADWKRISFRCHTGSGYFMDDMLRGDNRAHTIHLAPRTFDRTPIKEAAAIVPLIPPFCRPTKNLENYHILWEAEWIEPPRDPLLLKHLIEGFYAVLAEWNLSPLESQILRQTRSNESVWREMLHKGDTNAIS